MSLRGRELFVLRHGKSDWNAEAASDVDRPLAGRGKRDCRTMAIWAAEQGLFPDVIVSSTAERAADSARSFGRGLGLDEDDIVWEPRLYLASAQTLLEALAAVPQSARQVVLVGHNPGLDELVCHLHGGTPHRTRSGKLMTTGAIAWFRMPDDWSQLAPGCAELVQLARPKELSPF